MKFLITTNNLIKIDSQELPYKLDSRTIGPFTLYTSDNVSLVENNRYCCISDGYFRDYQKEVDDISGQKTSTVEAIANSWPLAENFTGSFSAIVLRKKDFSVVVCNDPIGVYPLYYLNYNNELFISNSLLVIGIVTGVNFDEVGVVQRCIGPEYLNFGSRTILQNCKRLLPGEKITLDSKGKIMKKEYDNTLYQQMNRLTQEKDFFQSFWRFFKREVAYCVNDSKEVKLALSGGIDSRIVLGALPEDKKISCVTFGETTNYETKIAKKLARLKNADFQNYFFPEIFFPSYSVMKKYSIKTEAVYLCSWLEILENSEPSASTPLLIGDLTTALTGRTITKYSTKKFRKDNFLKYQILKNRYPFLEANSENFEMWKAGKVQELEKWYTEKRLQEFDISISKETLLESLRSDLEELFKRIQDHKLPYEELFDEIFTWFTHTRIPMAKQILVCNDNYKSFCPSMSLGILRLSSSIHPNERLNFRFLKKLISNSPDLQKLFALPTSQAPYVPHTAPDFLKFPVWGFRSIADQYLIKRLMKSKNLKKRYRLFSSTNWAMLYQNSEMEKNLVDYFSPNHIGEKHFQNLLQKAIGRKNLQEWPFANLDIINSSSLNVEMDLIKSYRRKK